MSSRVESVGRERKVRCVLVASGYIAGGSIAGVFAAVVAVFGWDKIMRVSYSENASEIVAIVMLFFLSFFMYQYSKRTQK